MLHSTRGIVFHQLKYAESSVIVKIYTERFGLQSYIVRGIHGRKSKIKPALLQNLSLVDLVVYHREKKEIQELKEIRINHPFYSIPFDVRKAAVVMFINEILNKVIHEEEANESLFEFLYRSVIQLDEQVKGMGKLHLQFLLKLSVHLGFAPVNNFSERKGVFDLREGKFGSIIIHPEYFASMPFSNYISSLMRIDFGDTDKLAIPSKDRAVLLDILLRYYFLHVPGMKEVKSHQVLKSIFND